MEFALDETQQAVRDLADEVLGRQAQQFEPDGGTGFDFAAWKALGESGLLSLAAPERLGGDGLGPLETGLVLRAVGRAGARVPALATLAFGVLPIARLGTREQQDELLGESGRVFTAALNEPSNPLPATPGAAVRGNRVSGRKIGVLHADLARRLLVSASGADGPIALLVDPGSDGVRMHRAPGSLGDEWVVDLDDAPAETLGDGTGLADLHACALAGICSLADGAVAAALDLTAEHLRTRHQFGKPLAAFQAVAQQVADVYVLARTLHLAALSGCWRLATGRDAAEDLDIAAYWLAEKAPAAMRTCHHLHGGLGLDITYPLHRHHSQIKDLARLVGGAGHRLDAVAAHGG
ncbi:acyl-CoA dehydrogenase family protein [Saccharopolyspora griseoalba]|uniref:Acyl-CoA dehydrogenase family protein n=1 Tax=Saccharopolyspora griseoalba TaxID=1431848 RepID=A0ABW2LLQ4_9PSEU